MHYWIQMYLFYLLFILTAGRFTFQVQLHREAGKIVFAYRKVCYYPVLVQAHAFSR